METIEKSVEVLNDLIQINNDRAAGFTKAIKDLEADDLDLKAIFEGFVQESNQNATELATAVAQIGGQAETGTSGSGSLHRAWIDVKATFTGHTRKSILEECERGEDAIKKSYRDALTDDNGLSPELVQLITRQQQGVIAAHDKVKALRDSQ